MVPVTGHPGRRPTAKGSNHRWHVKEIVRPFPAPAEPARVRPRHHLEDSRRSVPGERHIPFPVTVIEKNISLGVEAEVIGIAVTLGNHLTLLKVRPKSDNRSCTGLSNRRTGQVKIGGRHSRHVSDCHVPPAIRASLDTVGMVLATCLDLPEHLGLAIGTAIPVPIPVTQQPTPCNTEQVGAIKAKSLGTRCRSLGKRGKTIGPAVPVVIDQRPHVPPAADNHPAFRVEGHRVDIVCQFIIGEQFHLESVRHLDAILCRNGLFLSSHGEREEDSENNGQAEQAEHLHFPREPLT